MTVDSIVLANGQVRVREPSVIVSKFLAWLWLCSTEMWKSGESWVWKQIRVQFWLAVQC